MTVYNTAKRDVYRPTMRRELKEAGNKGVEVIMVDLNGDGIPDPPPIILDSITITGEPLVGARLMCLLFEPEGGSGDLRVSTQWTNENGDNLGSLIYHDNTVDDIGHTLKIVATVTDNGFPDSDPLVVESNSIGPIGVTSLVVSEPVVSGEPWVGETLTCSEPTVTGGVGPYQFDYFWVDESNVIVWEAPKMQPNTIVTTYDIDKMMKCLVTVTDKGWDSGESVTVESNSIGPIGQHTIGNVTVMVDGKTVAGDEAEDAIQTRTGESHVILLQFDGDADSLGVKYDYQVRNGEARLLPQGYSCVAIIESLYPGSVHIQCKIEDRNTVEGEWSQRVVFIVRE